MGTYTRKVKKKNLTVAQGSRYANLSSRVNGTGTKKEGTATNPHYRIRTQKKKDKLNTLRTK